MTELNPLQAASLLILTFTYLTCYRGTLKMATIWGAFEFGNKTGKWKFPVALLFLVFVPILIYSLELRIVPLLPQEIFRSSISPLLIIAQIFLICIIILLISLFPLAMKHLWCVIAQSVEMKQPDAGWIHTNFNRTKLPHPIYSAQVIVLNGLIPIAISFVIIKFCGMPKFFGSELFFKMYLILYASQFTVLYNISKERKYFDHHKKLIISWRMLGTLIVTIVFPMIVGIAILPLHIRFLHFLEETNMSWINILFCILWVILLLVYLPFPYYMNQSLLLLARKYKWAPERIEIMKEGRPWVWWTYLVTAVSCVIIWFILYRFNVIDLNLILDVTQKLSVVISKG